MGLAVIVHGGAGAIPAERYPAAREGCREAALAGWRALQQGGSALDAVQAAIIALEDNPGFNAGTGGVLNASGQAELDAGLMDGAELAAGAVAGVQRIKNPIMLARLVLASPHVLLMGEGAEQFAVASGMALCAPDELITAAQRARWQRGYALGDDVNVGGARDASASDTTLEVGAVAHEHEKANGRAGTTRRTQANDRPVHADGHKHGTVGAVAVDAQGNVAAGASTGGIGNKHPGRIGDTPIVGAGFCAENGLGGVSSTGRGEDFIRLLLARRALDYIAAGDSAQAAATKAIQLLGRRVGGSGGLILLDAAGRVGYARNTTAMAHAFMVEGMGEPFAGV
ncbi:MAG TPA: isoaspartyl peptidase/L-asparaginase [Ktedonobacterales bacterium]|nr:isoaspartyl peptidase/L-asparaginase [Ktedonobacterales bacterium]